VKVCRFTRLFILIGMMKSQPDCRPAATHEIVRFKRAGHYGSMVHQTAASYKRFQLAIAGCEFPGQCARFITMPNRQLTIRKSKMSQRQLKTGYFILEGLNSFASVYYQFYLYFYMQMAFGFGNKANLVLAAANGLIYMVGSFFAGRFAQRFGYFKSLKLGLTIMILGLCAAVRVDSSGGQIT